MKVLGFVAAAWLLSVTQTDPAIDFGYLTPEQLSGERVGPPADIFTFGAVCYELFGGKKAFDGPLADVATKIAAGRVQRRLSELQPALDRSILDLVERCLQVDSSARPTMSEAVSVLGRYLDRAADDDTVTAPAPRTFDFDREIVAAQPRTSAPPVASKAPVPTGSFPEFDPLAPDEPDAVPCVDHNVQFTVYRPSLMSPERWYPMPVFVHLAERRPDAPPDEPDPIVEVSRQAAQTLTDVEQTFLQLRQDSRASIPHEGVVRIVPTMAGVQFNPIDYQLQWLESVHQAPFRMRASRAMDGRVARGMIAVYLGLIPIAEIALAIPVDSAPSRFEPSTRHTARPYRRIFASYSHRDEAIVRQFDLYARGIGDRYMRDVIDLRSGEQWNDRLLEMIDTADVFQLFWSRNAMTSAFVRREWEHALTVTKPDFIRPLYWETPFPESEGLPPAPLKARHFAFVGAPATATTEQVAAERMERHGEASRQRHEAERRARETRAAWPAPADIPTPVPVQRPVSSPRVSEPPPARRPPAPVAEAPPQMAPLPADTPTPVPSTAPREIAEKRSTPYTIPFLGLGGLIVFALFLLRWC